MRQPTRRATTTGRITQFRPEIRSRHPSHAILRAANKHLPLFPFRTIVRLGSTTETDATRYAVEVNSIESIRTSSNKLLMKEAFERAGVKSALWDTANNLTDLLALARILTEDWKGRIVTKAKYGSKGQGNTLIASEADLRTWAGGKRLSDYIFEKFTNYGLEFRLHITSEGCFYTCRKALRKDVPEDQKWRHHDDTCVWFLEENENFQKPNSWDTIVEHCVRALNAVGADVLSFDVKVQKGTNSDGTRRTSPQDFILLECNSASSLGSPDNPSIPGVCASKYIEELPRIIQRKIDRNV